MRSHLTALSHITLVLTHISSCRAKRKDEHPNMDRTAEAGVRFTKSWPEKTAGSQVIDAPVSHMDILNT